MVSFPTTRREIGKECVCSQPAGTALMSSTAREHLPIGRGWGIAEVIVMPREISRGSDILECPGRFRRTPLLLFPADLLLSPSFSIASACWGGTSDSSNEGIRW